MKLIILGNGFDLSHNLKTSFNDFRSYLVKSNDKEDHILIKQIDELVKNNSGESDKLQWNDFERIIGHRLNPSIKFEDMKNINLASLVEKFTEKFHAYILNIVETKNIVINQNLLKEFDNVSEILSFNYTSFYDKYLKNINDKNIFHIHGKMDENNLPIIGYYYNNVKAISNSTDYVMKYNNRLIHKSALAYKQNETNLDADISNYKINLEGQISEIVIMGYSFGESDLHIYDILNKIIIWQSKADNTPISKSDEIRTVKFKIYSYNDSESEIVIQKIKDNFSRIKRKISTNITGVGFSSQKKDLIYFELAKY